MRRPASMEVREGTHWGDAGYVYISQKNNCCGVATAATYPIIA